MVIDRSKTQISTTKGTYVKVANFINENKKNASVLDFGAGLCLGTATLNEHENITAKSFEPFAQEGIEPDFACSFDISGEYDFVISNCVLNVVEDLQERTRIVADIANLLNKGGKAIIMVRSRPAVKANKTNKEYADGFVNSKGTFQRGFTTKELSTFVEEAVSGLYEDFEVETTKLGDVGVILKRVK